MNNSNLGKINEANQLLLELNQKANIDGIIFAYRDGGVIIEIIGDEFNSKNFTSMCASVLESAVGIGETMGNRKINKIITELAEKTIFIFECDIKTFLILIAKKESNVNLIFSKLQDYIQSLVKLY
ncbi:MAG: hypothetical protein HWN81_18250 [Candidatus Lokiarchaeota archaeon]|nr:hypothetical protein [Candidatus Lokiarchaeota archaeon]